MISIYYAIFVGKQFTLRKLKWKGGSMARCLITGSHGFIGNHLTERLEQMKCEVVRMPRHLLGRPDLLSHYIKELKPEYIFHLAAYGNHYHQKYEREIFKVNVEGTWNLLEATKDIDYKAFVNFSTSSVNLPVQTLYAITKKMAEELASYYAKTKPIVNIRPYSVYGEGEADFRFIPTICRCLIKNETLNLDPDARHDWIYVEDFISKVIHVVQKDYWKGKTAEIGTGMSWSNQEIVDILEEIAGKQCGIKKISKMRSYDNKEWVCNRNWNMNYSLKEALKRTYEYYKQKFET